MYMYMCHASMTTYNVLPLGLYTRFFTLTIGARVFFPAGSVQVINLTAPVVLLHTCISFCLLRLNTFLLPFFHLIPVCWSEFFLLDFSIIPLYRMICTYTILGTGLSNCHIHVKSCTCTCTCTCVTAARCMG